MRKSKRIQSSAFLLILATFAIYLAALTQRSLWLDEGATLARLYSTWDHLWRNRLPICKRQFG